MTQVPDGVPRQLLGFLRKHCLDFDFVAPGVPMPTVLTAAAAAGVSAELILKTLLFVDDDGAFVVAIANGTHRVDQVRLGEVAALRRPRAADPADVFAVTGYPAGGLAPLGLPATVPVIVDAATAALTFAFGGGGQEHLLLRVQVADVIRCNSALVADITKRPNDAVP